MKLYTKKGDRGQTSLFSGRRAAKFDPRVAAVGDLDELTASLGLARVVFPEANDLLSGAQKALYTISAIVSAEARKIDLAFDDAETAALEAVARARERARHLNRLSDLLFALARLADLHSGHADRMLGG